MDRETALKVIEDSLARGSATPCTWREDRDVYVEEESARLLDYLIDPCQANIVSEANEYGTLDPLRGEEVFAVARAESNWLLYAPASKRFALAFGSDPNKLSILGFSSDDVLAEWLG